MESLKILRSRIPAGGFGRALTATELRDIRKAGNSVSNSAIVLQDRADYRGVVYNPARAGGFAHSGVLVETRD